MHEVLVNRLGGLSLPRKRVIRLTDSPDMTLDDYRGRKTTTQQQQCFPAHPKYPLLEHWPYTRIFSRGMFTMRLQNSHPYHPYRLMLTPI